MTLHRIHARPPKRFRKEFIEFCEKNRELASGRLRGTARNVLMSRCVGPSENVNTDASGMHSKIIAISLQNFLFDFLTAKTSPLNRLQYAGQNNSFKIFMCSALH